MSEFGFIVRSLRGTSVRSLVTLAGIAAIAVLILTLQGLHRGLLIGVRHYLDEPRADVWVTPPGSDNFIRSSAFLPTRAESVVTSLDGVEAVSPVLRGFLSVSRVPAENNTGRTDADQVPTTLLGMAYRAGAPGGPPVIPAGRAARGAREIVLDRAAAFRLGVTVGDTIRVNDRRVTVAGLSSSTNLVATQLAFVDLDSARSTFGVSTLASFLVVSLRPGVDAEAFASRVRTADDGLRAMTRAQFIRNNEREVGAGLAPVMLTIISLAVAIAAALVLILVQSRADEQRFEIATLLALGVAPGRITLALLSSAALLTAAGVIVGTALCLILAYVLDSALPTVTIVSGVDDMLLTLALLEVTTVVGALLPVLKLRNVDPLEVFRE